MLRDSDEPERRTDSGDDDGELNSDRWRFKFTLSIEDELRAAKFVDVGKRFIGCIRKDELGNLNGNRRCASIE